MGSERDATKTRSRYSSRPVKKSKRQLKMEDCTKMKTIKEICNIFPQCEFCHRHCFIVKRNTDVEVLKGKAMPLVQHLSMQYNPSNSRLHSGWSASNHDYSCKNRGSVAAYLI